MTPKEKAKDLFDKYWIFYVKDTDAIGIHNLTKQCAIIAVDEILKSNPCSEDSDRGGNFMWVEDTYYWEQVKQELTKQQEQ
jgi:hypothetical protein